MDVKTYEGMLTASGKRFGIVASRWNSFFADRLVEGAIDVLVRHGADADDIAVAKCPGAFEIPMVARRLSLTGRYDAIICLGVLIRGSTPHFDYIAAEATKGIGLLGLNGDVPLSYGVITVDTLDQAVERSGSKAGNKGEEAAMAAIEMVNLFDAIDE